MTYEWNQDFIDGNTRAACSKCGVPYRWPDELVKLDDGFFYCKRRCLEQTVRTRDRIIAQSRKRREMPPPKFVQAPRYAYDYLKDEDQIFALVLRAAPGDALGAAASPGAAATAGAYLADMIVEARRPASWMSAARTTLAACCDYLLTVQHGNPVGPSPSATSTDIRYGGISSSGFNAGTTAAAGLAFIKGYEALGTPAYLDAADRVATNLRALQCSDLYTTAPSVYPSGGTPYHTGGIVLTQNAGGAVTFSAQVMQVSASALKFFSLLAEVRGNAATYGVTSAAYLTSSSVATLATMQAECVTFMTVGATDFGTGAVLNPFSTATPRNYYYPFGNSGDGSWHSGTDTVLLMAYVIEALNETGNAAAAVADFFAWAMTFTSSTANQIASGANLIGNNKGTFDPTYTMASAVNVTTKKESTGAIYDWRWFGVTAAFQSATYAAQFTRAKDLLGVPQAKSSPFPNYTYISPIGRCGLSFQPNLTPSVSFAAQVGNAYRFQPQAFGDVYNNPTGRNP